MLPVDGNNSHYTTCIALAIIVPGYGRKHIEEALFMKQQSNDLNARIRANWITLILQMLENANAQQLRDIYLLLRGYLGNSSN